jgi:AraC family transcriptional regulator
MVAVRCVQEAVFGTTGHHMSVRVVNFPETKIAVVEHRGSPETEHETVKRLIAWRKAKALAPGQHRSFGLHYNDPRTTAPADYRVDFAVEYERDIAPNPHGVIAKRIPGGRCALMQHLGPRDNITAAVYLYEVWLPQSGEVPRDCPIIFHYVNVGPSVKAHEMVTDVYLPLQ